MNSSISSYSSTSFSATTSGAIPRFTSTGKEKDSESGYHYFGARYYDSEVLTGWLSVDPMADKYPGISPYAYCVWTRPTGGNEHRWIKYNTVNNPVKQVDPDGMCVGKPPTNLIYTIQKGDNFWQLEKQWNLPHGTLQSINPNVDPNKLQVGQEVNAAIMEGNLIIVGNSVSIPQSREFVTPTEEGPFGVVSMASSSDFSRFKMAFESLMPSMGSYLPSISLRSFRGNSNISKIVKRASNGKGNFGVGCGTYAEAMEAGEQWVGKGYRRSSRDENILISQDGKRQFRAPSYKPKSGKYQANFQSRTTNSERFENNGHMNITR